MATITFRPTEWDRETIELILSQNPHLSGSTSAAIREALAAWRNQSEDTMNSQIIYVDVDLSDDAMGVENGNTVRYMEMLRTALKNTYPDAEMVFTHRSNGRVEVEGMDDGEAHTVNHIINQTWETWLQDYE